MDQKYVEYLQSEHWASLRRSAVDIFPNGCLVTGNHSFQLHHLNYFHIKQERFWADLIPLCKEKHDEFHKFAIAHSLQNYEVLKWIDDKGYRIDSEVRRKLIITTEYNIKLIKQIRNKKLKKIVQKKKRKDITAKRRARKALNKHLHYYNLVEKTFERRGRKITLFVKKS